MIVDIIIVGIILLFGFFGARKGFVGSLLGFLNNFVSLIVSILIAKPVAEFLKPTAIGEWVSKTVAGIHPSSDTFLADLANSFLPTLESWMLIAISFVICYIVCFVAIKLITVFSSAITSLPIIKQMDSLLGFLFGILQSLIVIFVVLAILSLFENSTFMQDIFQYIENSYLLKFFYENNLITKILFGEVLSVIID